MAHLYKIKSGTRSVIAVRTLGAKAFSTAIHSLTFILSIIRNFSGCSANGFVRTYTRNQEIPTGKISKIHNYLSSKAVAIALVSQTEV